MSETLHVNGSIRVHQDENFPDTLLLDQIPDRVLKLPAGIRNRRERDEIPPAPLLDTIAYESRFIGSILILSYGEAQAVEVNLVVEAHVVIVVQAVLVLLSNVLEPLLQYVHLRLQSRQK